MPGIPFVPPRGRILICNHDMARVHPEMAKERRVVVMSPRSYNARHGNGPGRCLVVPFSTTAPVKLTPGFVPFPVGVYQSLSQATWAVCEALSSMSHARLNQVNVAGTNLQEHLLEDDIDRIVEGIRHVLGIV